LALFLRSQIFDHVDNLSHREMLGEEDAQKVSATLEELRQVFFKPLPHDELSEKEKALKRDDELYDQMSAMAFMSPWVTVHDNRQR
jgi:hypothetical protein